MLPLAVAGRQFCDIITSAMEGETTAEVPFVFEAPKYTDLEHDEANEQYVNYLPSHIKSQHTSHSQQVVQL
jgi:hypothetical protein